MIGRLLDDYRRRGLYDEAIVLFTSDHGESLGEHGELTHGIFLFDATVRVPLILRAPDLAAGRSVASQVQLIDIAPTLLALLGLDPEPHLQGRSLVPLTREKADTAPSAYIETRLPLENHGWFDLRGIRTEPLKLVSGPTTELYDLAADPQELQNVFEAHRETATRVLETLHEAFPERAANLSAVVEMDEATRGQLTALGYISTGRSSSRPKPGVSRYAEKRMRLTLELLQRGFRRRALERCGEIVPEAATSEDCIGRLTRLFRVEGGDLDSLTARSPSASEAAQDADPSARHSALGPDSAALLAAAEAAVQRGDLSGVREKLIALTGVLLGPDAHFRRGAPARGRVRDARTLKAAASLSRIGDACWERLSYENAVHAYLIGSRLVPGDPRFHYNLGLTWERLGDMDEALQAFESALEIDPHFAKAEPHRRYAEAVVRRLRAATSARTATDAPRSP
jgi:tetratricopeptide (TPR) repeat protein